MQHSGETSEASILDLCLTFQFTTAFCTHKEVRIKTQHTQLPKNDFGATSHTYFYGMCHWLEIGPFKQCQDIIRINTKTRFVRTVFPLNSGCIVPHIAFWAFSGDCMFFPVIAFYTGQSRIRIYCKKRAIFRESKKEIKLFPIHKGAPFHTNGNGYKCYEWLPVISIKASWQFECTIYLTQATSGHLDFLRPPH